MSSDTPILDRRRFGLLRLPPGAEPEEESLALLVSSFVASSAATVDEMRSAAAAADGPAIAALAHRLKGASALFGAIRLRDACGALQDAARAAADRATIEARIGDLATALEAARAAMERELEE